MAVLTSSHGRAPETQSAIRPTPDNAAIHLNRKPCIKSKLASGVQSLNCAAPGTASKSVPGSPEGALYTICRTGSETVDESRA
eukprot:9127632-Alexandrium_andersonii.AAC.1